MSLTAEFAQYQLEPGETAILTSGNELLAVYFLRFSPAGPQELFDRDRRYFPQSAVSGGLELIRRLSPLSDEAAAQLDQYFAGGRRTFDLPLYIGGSAFRRDVLAALSRVQFGTVETYGGLAQLAGHPGAARAVGSVMRGNTLPVILPCHRVVSSEGIGGYSLGLELKKKLLDIEGVNCYE